MKKEYDFSKGKKVSPSRVDPSPKIMISIRMDALVLSALKEEAKQLEIGYQTLIANILGRHIGTQSSSVEERLLKKILDRLNQMDKSKTKKARPA
jgi:uncharacterized protein (DUF4415 family)